MESNQQDPADSKSSSCKEETDQIRSENDHDMVAGRSYECVFCKRGFTTAQALGGHMNIHRKDRAKTSSRPSSMIVPNSVSAGSKVDHDDDDDRHNLFPNLIHRCPVSDHDLQFFPHVNYQTFFPAPSWKPPYTLNSGDVYVPILNQFHLKKFEDDDHGDCWRGALSLGVGSSPHVDGHGRGHDREKRERGSDGEDDELDLELRLGHHDHR
ncbi:uncharacterized protein LOC110815004 [Carica papaya]|uniref:uncharacterized protein LOC110815004 n=1 Tax=Carica papaya TaxID=3649 RepID=UPI000B8CE98B|nr:uncharacterized protein LOC110815004 [Carica papaya]